MTCLIIDVVDYEYEVICPEILCTSSTKTVSLI